MERKKKVEVTELLGMPTKFHKGMGEESPPRIKLSGRDWPQPRAGEEADASSRPPVAKRWKVDVQFLVGEVLHHTE